MKYNVLLLMFLVAWLAAGCNSNEGKHIPPTVINNPSTASGEVSEEALPVLTFDSVERHFGTIVQGQTVKKVYRFTNTGNAELVIASAQGSCGCTVPDWPKRPIKPGQSGEIEVVFKSEGKKGRQHKKIYIVANTKPATTTLSLVGDVVAPE